MGMHSYYWSDVDDAADVAMSITETFLEKCKELLKDEGDENNPPGSVCIVLLLECFAPKFPEVSDFIVSEVVPKIKSLLGKMEEKERVKLLKICDKFEDEILKIYPPRILTDEQKKKLGVE